MLKDIISESLLRKEYEVATFSDLEIAQKYQTSARSVCRLRKIYGIRTDPHYQYRRNPFRFLPLTDKISALLKHSWEQNLLMRSLLINNLPHHSQTNILFSNSSAVNIFLSMQHLAVLLLSYNNGSKFSPIEKRYYFP